MIESAIINHVGKRFIFEDGRSVKIVQVKYRDLGEGSTPYVTFEIDYNNSFPKRHIIAESEFIGKFGHLFFNNNT
jgi:hypothetical protein